MKFSNLRHGFTLIETLVVVSLLGIVMLSVTQSLLTSIRGSTKASIAREVKQNGDYALSLISTNLRNAQVIQSALCTSTRVNYQDLSGNNSYFECKNLDGSVGLDAIVWQVGTASEVSITSDKVEIASCQISCSISGTSADIEFILRQNNIGNVSETFQSTFRSTIFTRNQ
jgi:prepilin-type N-terminal cleavage/methylation domain-containing protein